MVEMIRSSASQSPEQRLKFIKESAQSTIDESKQYMKEFGITMTAGSTPLNIEARIMSAPALMYGQNREMSPINGKWELRNYQFYRPAKLTDWIIIRFSDRTDNKLKTFEQTIRDTGRQLGMDISEAKRTVTIGKKSYKFENVPKYFENAQKISANIQIIFFVISPQMESIYERIKKVGDIDFGIPTQCIKESNMENPKYSTSHYQFIEYF